jgi:hypothetical protein
MNTYVLAFWLTASWNEDPSWFNLVCAGLSAGLAIFTKGTAYAYLPFLVLACWWMGSASARIKYLKRAAPRRSFCWLSPLTFLNMFAVTSRRVRRSACHCPTAEREYAKPWIELTCAERWRTCCEMLLSSWARPAGASTPGSNRHSGGASRHSAPIRTIRK